MRSKSIYFMLMLTLSMIVGLLVWITVTLELAVYLVIAEILAVMVISLLIILYQKTVKPIQTIVRAMDLLSTQDLNSRLIPVKQVEVDKIVDVFNKMVGQIKSERIKLREKNQILDILIESSPMGVIMLDREGSISLINPAAIQILSCGDNFSYIGKQITDLNSTISNELSSLKIGGSKIVNLNDANIYKCARNSFIVNGYNHTFYQIEKMTEELLSAQKKAYEKVIRIIAHEVNNSMAGVVSTLDIISEDSQREVATLLTTSSERCSNLSNFITKFANVVKIPDPMAINIPLDQFILNNSRVIESQGAGRDIKFVFNLDSDNRNVKIDTILMEQVVINIIKNGVEAIEGSGEIVLSTYLHPLRLEISNNGVPIDSLTQKNLFSPFFSTKLDGKGIGLIVVRDILKKHNCRFNLATDNDGITRFAILFE